MSTRILFFFDTQRPQAPPGLSKAKKPGAAHCSATCSQKVSTVQVLLRTWKNSLCISYFSLTDMGKRAYLAGWPEAWMCLWCSTDLLMWSLPLYHHLIPSTPPSSLVSLRQETCQSSFKAVHLKDEKARQGLLPVSKICYTKHSATCCTVNV